MVFSILKRARGWLESWLMADLRDEYLSRVVQGKSFAEVGGLWGTVNEKVSVARDCGAEQLTMIDITEEGGDLWQAFEKRMGGLGVQDYRCISSDICAVDDLQFDVVHCSGVLYHHPNPQTLLAALRRATREHLVICSAITQERIENKAGVYQIPPSGVLFVPALTEEERAVLSEYWLSFGVEAHGITEAVRYSPEEFGPWWWLPTAEAMKAMCAAAGFKVLDSGPIWNGNALVCLLERI